MNQVIFSCEDSSVKRRYEFRKWDDSEAFKNYLDVYQNDKLLRSYELRQSEGTLCGSVPRFYYSEEMNFTNRPVQFGFVEKYDEERDISYFSLPYLIVENRDVEHPECTAVGGGDDQNEIRFELSHDGISVRTSAFINNEIEELVLSNYSHYFWTAKLGSSDPFEVSDARDSLEREGFLSGEAFAKHHRRIAASLQRFTSSKLNSNISQRRKFIEALASRSRWLTKDDASKIKGHLGDDEVTKIMFDEILNQSFNQLQAWERAIHMAVDAASHRENQLMTTLYFTSDEVIGVALMRFVAEKEAENEEIRNRARQRLASAFRGTDVSDITLQRLSGDSDKHEFLPDEVTSFLKSAIQDSKSLSLADPSITIELKFDENGC